jgi:hypothetical protein
MSDRIQREVEEVLANLEKFPPKKPLGRRISDAIGAPFRTISRALSNLHLPSISAGHVLLAAIAIIVVAYVAGGSSNLWNYIIAGGIILFIAAFVMSLRRQSKPPEKYWRDRPLDESRSGPGHHSQSWMDRWRRRR